MVTNSKKKANTKPTWQEYFLEIAKAVSIRATCPRAHSGVILVKNRRIISTGYNGAPPGYSECLTHGCIIVNNSCIRTIHGERNTIDWAEKYHEDLSDAEMYEYFEAFNKQSIANYYPKESAVKDIEFFPCVPCKELIKMVKIKSIICKYGNGIIISYSNK